MPKKIKLTPEQQEQEAAVQEIEAFFNEEKVESKKLKVKSTTTKLKTNNEKKLKGKSIAVKETSSSNSPYLVDLGIIQRRKREKESEEKNLKNKTNKLLSFFSKKKDLNYSTDFKNCGNFFPKGLNWEKTSATLEKVDATIKQVGDIAIENIKKILKPISTFFNLVESEIKNFYNRREDVLSELLVINVLVVIISGIKRLINFLFSTVNLIVKSIYALFILVIGVIVSLINLFIFIKKFVKYIAIKTEKIFLQSTKKVSVQGLIITKKTTKLAYQKINLFMKRLFFYAFYPFKASYSNIKKFFQVAKNETTDAFSKARIVSVSGAENIKKQASKANQKIKASIIKKIAVKFFSFLEIVGRTSTNFAKSLISFFSSIIYSIKSLFTFKFLPPMAWPKQLAVFVVLGFILIFPLKVFGYLNIFKDIKGQVLGESEQAISSLQQAAEASGEFNFLGAASYFSEAADSFNQAQSVLADYSNLITIANIIPAKKAKLAATGRSLIASGKNASEIGEYITLAVDSLELDNPEETKPLTERLKQFSYYANLVNEKLYEFENNIDQVDPEVVSSLKIDQQEKIIQQLKSLKVQTGIFRKGMNELLSLSDILPIFLGDETDKRYLLIFQNNAEMRASGGFIGSYALIDFGQGKIKKLEVPGGGSYDLQGGLHKRIAAPEPLHLINSLWEFQDSNWWPDWPTSAQKIQWFFENGWGSSVDGVIAIDTTFAERLLEIIGPIDMREKYGEIITSENFYHIVQTQSERKDTNTPKEIITDLVNKVIEELPSRINSDNLFNIIKDIEQLFLEKHVLLNFNDSALQDFIVQHNWEGEIKDTDSDYLAVINTNIAGGKSDRKIKQAIEHTAEIMPDGSVINNVVITRRHNGIKNEAFTGVRNVNYLRVYVPQGSQLLEASGFYKPDAIFFDEPAEGAELDPDIHFTENIAKIDEDSGVRIYSEFGKTVFGHWTQVDPGQTIVINYKYKLPFKVNSIVQKNNFLTSLFKGDEIIHSYSLLAQKQPGSIEDVFSSKLILPENMEIRWATNESVLDQQGWQKKSNLRQDRIWGALIKKIN